MKICLLGATFGTTNMGVGTLTAGCITSIYQSLPRAEVFLLDYGKEPASFEFSLGDRKLRIPMVNMRFSKKVYLENNVALLLLLSLLLKLIPAKRIRDRIIIRNPCLYHISQAEVTAAISGGDSFSDIYGLRRFFYVTLPQLLVLFMGKKLVLLPQTIGPFKGIFPRFIANYIMRRAELVYSRDYFGVAETRNLLELNDEEQKVRFCYDVGFGVEPVKPENIDLDGLEDLVDSLRPLVGLNVSGLLYMGGYTRKNMFGLRVDYQKLVYQLIEHFITNKDAAVLLVPHVFGTKEHAESDSAVCADVYAALNGRYGDKLFLARGAYNQNEIKHIIGLCDFFIGSRMHACIAALSQGIPTVPVAYSKKFIGVMETIGVDSYVADPRTMDEHEIMRIVDMAWAEKDNIRRHLESKIPEVKTRVLNLFKEIAAMLGIEERNPGR